MTANRIKEVALTHFAEHGYEGASLAHIADEVGIKKPSIYAHFKGKDDLFLHVIRDVSFSELEFVTRYFQAHDGKSLSCLLHDLIRQYKERYERSDRIKFWMRMMYFPPVPLEAAVMKLVYQYLDHMEVLLEPVFKQAAERGEIVFADSQRAAIAFMCMLDGVLVELLYGGTERFDRRLEASWDIYWRGITR
ncbi:TetR/AcrR family transcriptional regulator [Brevibacillus massiliensis]|uniref:TetR/AcrR family transcriptional regulator n=1 Tax=Brevibacillus massiliensis TaxID=1118054 RepID=UPI0002E57028|nr:TetR/AcrR family transcriptional regulator [Brevibacillus massiliensis]